MEAITSAPGDEAASYVAQSVMPVVSAALDRILVEQPRHGTELGAFGTYLRALNPKRQYKEVALVLPKQPDVVPPPVALGPGKSPLDGLDTSAERRRSRGSSLSMNSNAPADESAPALPSFRGLGEVPSEALTSQQTISASPLEPSAGTCPPTREAVPGDAVDGGDGGEGLGGLSAGDGASVGDLVTPRLMLSVAPRRTVPTTFELKFTTMDDARGPADASGRSLGGGTDAPLIVLNNTDADDAPAPLPLHRCRDLPVYAGEFPVTRAGLDALIAQLLEQEQLSHVTFVVASTPCVTAQLEDGYVYRAEVGSTLWNLAAYELQQLRQRGDAHVQREFMSPRDAAHDDGGDEDDEAGMEDGKPASPRTFGARLNAQREARENGNSLLRDMGIDPTVLELAEAEEAQLKRRLQNARRMSNVRGVSKLRMIVQEIIENRRALPAGGRSPLSPGGAFLTPGQRSLGGNDGRPMTAGAQYAEIDDEQMEAALLKRLFPPQLSPTPQRGSISTPPKPGAGRKSITGSSLSMKGAASSASPSASPGTSPPKREASRNIARLSTRLSSTFGRSKGSLLEAALRIAEENRRETADRKAMSVQSGLMVLKAAARAYAEKHPAARVAFAYRRIMHPRAVPFSVRVADKVLDILGAVPEGHDSAIVVLGLNQDVLVRHIAALAAVHFRILREVQAAHRTYNAYDAQDKRSAVVDIRAHRQRIAAGRAERDEQRAVIAEAIRPKLRAVEQVESPAECRARLLRAANERQQRLERRAHILAQIDAIDNAQRERAAIKLQALVRGAQARRRGARPHPSRHATASIAGGPSTEVLQRYTLIKRLREGRLPLVAMTLRYLGDALGPDLVVDHVPRRSFTRTVTLYHQQRTRVAPAHEDDISSEDEAWEESTAVRVVPDRACPFCPLADAVEGLRAAGADDLQFLVDVVSEYDHVEPMQRKAAGIVEKLCHYVMFAAFCAIRIKLRTGYAARPGSHASHVFLQTKSSMRSIETLAGFLRVFGQPTEWARSMSVALHAASERPAALLEHRMLLGGPLGGTWIAELPAEENPAIDAARQQHILQQQQQAAAAADSSPDAGPKGPTSMKRLISNKTFSFARRASGQAHAGPSATGPTSPSAKRQTGAAGGDEYVSVHARRHAKLTMCAPVYVVPEVLTAEQWRETAALVGRDDGGKGNVRRVVWLSTCPHPRVYANGTPLFACERQCGATSHCITNPLVVDAATTPDPALSRRRTHSTGLRPAPDVGALSAGSRSPDYADGFLPHIMTGRPEAVLVSEAPLYDLLATVASDSDVPRLLTAIDGRRLRDEALYLADIEAGMRADLVAAAAAADGIIPFTPAVVGPDHGRLLPYWSKNLPRNGYVRRAAPPAAAAARHTTSSPFDLHDPTSSVSPRTDEEPGTAATTARLPPPPAVWGPPAGGGLVSHAVLAAVLCAAETTATWGMRPPAPQLLRVARPRHRPHIVPESSIVVHARQAADRLHYTNPGMSLTSAPTNLRPLQTGMLAAEGGPSPAAVAVGGGLGGSTDAGQGGTRLGISPAVIRKNRKQVSAVAGRSVAATVDAGDLLSSALPSPGGSMTREPATASIDEAQLPSDPATAIQTHALVAESVRQRLFGVPDMAADCFRCHRVPVRSGHAAELDAALSDIYALVVANADEPHVAFAVAVHDRDTSPIGALAVALVYELDLRRTYQRAEPATSGAGAPLSITAATAAPKSTRPAPYDMFPVLHRFMTDNVGLEMPRIASLVDGIAEDAGLYDGLIGAAARSVFWAMLQVAPDPPLVPRGMAANSASSGPRHSLRLPKRRESTTSEGSAGIVIDYEAEPYASQIAAAREQLEEWLEALRPSTTVLFDESVCPYGPVVPLDEAERRFERYMRLLLFASFVRALCDARRVSTATGRRPPNFAEHLQNNAALRLSLAQGTDMWEPPAPEPIEDTQLRHRASPRTRLTQLNAALPYARNGNHFEHDPVAERRMIVAQADDMKQLREAISATRADLGGTHGRPGGPLSPRGAAVHPFATVLPALCRPVTPFEHEYEGVRIWRQNHLAMHRVD